MAKVKCKLVTWEEIVGWCRELARKIRESGWIPDVVVAIARGGYVPARLLCDFLDVNDLVSVQVLHWGRAAEVTAEAHVKYPLNVDLSGKRVLIVDDICDTGDSIIIAREHVEKNCKPGEVRIAVMQWISPVAKIEPDYYVEEVKEWIWYQYTWTRKEDTTNFIEKMVKEEGERGKVEWRFEEIVEKFLEYYGIDVGREYYELALDTLVEEGLLAREERGGEVVYVLRR